MADPGPMVADLRAESDDLDALVAPLAAERWADPTPSPGWTIAHQIGHLLWTDRVALISVTDEAGFAEVLAEAMQDPVGFVDAGAEELAAMPPDELLNDWRTTRQRLHDALLTVDESRKLPWFGPPMSPASMATARLMETWAHGLDVADALGVKRTPTERLHSIAHLGVRTRDYAFVVNELVPPSEPFLVELQRARRRHLVLGSGGCRPAGHRRRGGLLLLGHPAASAECPRHHRARCRRAALAGDRPSLRGAARHGAMSA